MVDTAKRNKEFYDAEALQYDDIRYASNRGRRVNAFHQRVLGTLAELGERKYKDVLEVGCGTGRLLPYFSEHANEVIGVDASPGMLNVARTRIESKSISNIRVSEGDALNLSFPDNSFDLVYSILVLNLIPDFTSVFREVRRVMREDGCFIFSVPNLQSIYYPGGYVVNSRGKAFGKNDSGHRHSHWFTQREVDSALEDAGLVRHSSLGQPPWTGMIDDARAVSGTGVGGLLSKSVYVKAVVAP